MMKKFYKDLPVLVTGGAGFIGSHLSEALVNLGAHVTILDNFSTGSYAHIAGFNKQITLMTGDITNQQTCLQATQGKNIIFHAAAQVSVPESTTNPYHCFTTNVQGTLNLLQASRANNVERFMFSSSSAVYGAHEGICSETTPCVPTSPYGLSKLMGEWYCSTYTQLGTLKTISLRYFNVYGNRQNPHGTYAAVMAAFRERLRTNQPITIFGDGNQTRDFVPVQEVVTANLTLAMIAAGNGAAFNIGTGISISLLNLIERLKKEEFPASTSTIQFAPERPGDIKHSEASLEKMRKALAGYPL